MSTKQYDMDAWLASVEKPTIVVDGKTYVGRILSIQEWLPFQKQIQNGMNLEGDSMDAFLSFSRGYLYAIFPRPRLAKWKPDPVPVILKHPALTPLMTSFFEIQARAMTTEQATAPATNGTT